MTKERFAMAKNLKMCLTAGNVPRAWVALLTHTHSQHAHPRSDFTRFFLTGIGSDHVDLESALQRKITVAEVTFCNSVSVAEHVVMDILVLVRNFVPSYQQVVSGGWNIGEMICVVVSRMTFN